MLVCGILTLPTAAVLALTDSLTLAILGLVVLGGPAAVGSSLFFAHLRATGTAALTAPGRNDHVTATAQSSRA